MWVYKWMNEWIYLKLHDIFIQSRGDNLGFRADPHKVWALSDRDKKAQIENGLKFACPSFSFFGRVRALTLYFFESGRFGRVLSVRAEKAQIKNGLKFLCPSPMFFRALSSWPELYQPDLWPPVVQGTLRIPLACFIYNPSSLCKS